MQVQANDVIEKFSQRLSQLMKEGIIMEAQLELVTKALVEKDAQIADLTAKLAEKDKADTKVIDVPATS